MTDQQTRVLSMSMTNLLVKAVLEDSVSSGEQVGAVLPLEPGLYSDQTELLLSSLHPLAELTIYGPAVALSNLEVGRDMLTSFTLTLSEIVGEDFQDFCQCGRLNPSSVKDVTKEKLCLCVNNVSSSSGGVYVL